MKQINLNRAASTTVSQSVSGNTKSDDADPLLAALAAGKQFYKQQ